MNQAITLRQRVVRLLLGGGIFFTAIPAFAFTFDFEGGAFEGTLDTTISAGASVRMQDRDQRLVGKTNLQQNIDNRLCADPNGTSALDLGNFDPATDLPDVIDNGLDQDVTGLLGLTGCVGNDHPNLVRAPGSYNVNGDNGNLNYDKYDITYSALKVTSDLSMSMGNYGLFARGVGVFDPVNANFEEKHPANFGNNDYGFQPENTKRTKHIEDQLGFSGALQDAYVYGDFELGERVLSLRVGRQVVSWGESLTLVINSINTINVPNVIRLRTPGLDLKELFAPVELVYGSIGITEALSMEAFYQLKWRPIVPDPAGSFFSTSDVAGGGFYAMAGLGRTREDPDNIFDDVDQTDRAAVQDASGRGCFADPSDPNSPTNDGADRDDNTNGRAICRANDLKPDDDGQYGVSLKYYSEALNDTEFGFYFMNYHSRLPYASFYAAQGPASTVPDQVCTTVDVPDALGLLAAAGIPTTIGLPQGLCDALNGLASADTQRVVLDYPEDIRMFGMSFNTTLGDISVSGEYAYRQNQPLQIHGADLVFATLAPALQGARGGATPSYTEIYRFGGASPNDPYGNPSPIGPGEYIRGYERFPTGHGGTTFISASAQNPFGAEQMINILEVGFTKVYGMPEKGVQRRDNCTPGDSDNTTDDCTTTFVSGINFDAPGTDTHGSPGRDQFDPVDFNDDTQMSDVASLGNVLLNPTRNVNLILMQNPEQEPSENFADSFSWGFRFLTVLKYNNVFAGFNFEPLFGFFHDINGNSPGPGGNHLEGRKTILLGSSFSRGSFGGDFRYTWFTGAGDRNQERDRDFFSFSIKYQF